MNVHSKARNIHYVNNFCFSIHFKLSDSYACDQRMRVFLRCFEMSSNIALALNKQQTTFHYNPCYKQRSVKANCT